MKRVADTIKEVQYRRLLKRSFEPREEFLNSSRELFLAEVAKRRVAPYAPQFAWRNLGMQAFRYSFVFAAIAFVSTSGLVAYADTTNVRVDSPLYPLKRVGEQVRLTVVPAAKELEVHRELAERRANEFIQIETRKRPDDSGGVVELRKLEDTERELRQEFRKNIEAIDEHNTKQGMPAALIADRGLCLAAELVNHRGGNGKSEQYKRFEDQCKDLLKNDPIARMQDDRSSDDSSRRSSEDDRDDSRSDDTTRVQDDVLRDDGREGGKRLDDVRFEGEDRVRDDGSTGGKNRDRGGQRADNHDEIRGERD